LSDENEPKPILGPAARAKAEGRSYNIQLLKSAMAPLVEDDGKPRFKGPLPYLPVLGACELCPGRCCRLNVKVSLLDAIHYCHTLGLPFFAGLTFVPSDHKAHAFTIARDPRINPEPEGWIGTAEIQLRRKADGSCHALASIGGYDRCGVYAARPSLCRLYPMSWTSDVAKGNPGMILCPVPYGVTEREERQFLEDIEVSIERWEQHDDIVIAWHRESQPEERTVERFLAFAIPRAAAIAGVPYEKILAQGSPEQRLFAAMHGSKIIRRP
jgi:Fe-S-cluster containining protein